MTDAGNGRLETRYGLLTSIAAEAGVSVSTVSKVVHRRRDVGAATRARAAELSAGRRAAARKSGVREPREGTWSAGRVQRRSHGAGPAQALSVQTACRGSRPRGVRVRPSRRPGARPRGA
ncbi:LacI family DNA-binding transcriptional regulator [Streptomyces sp. ID05-04B]|uniref:LacI family DNA-binding transcriptional regulator n=1 Tax=Streptomyces sp. ID05-04B TaxID=3028661 RepID=UPI0029CA6743|nr:LacI family DNA-binding transcriptional regulator [Streptomyces sp. ID05-04B]